MEDYEIKYFAGRLTATRRAGWIAPTLYAMQLHWTEACQCNGEPTMGVDRNCRIYAHPDACRKWGVPEIAATQVHEAWHINLNHAERADVYRQAEGDAFDMSLFNIAADCVVNPCTRDLGFDMPAEQAWVFPKAYGLKEGLTLDEYYSKLKEQKEKEKQKQPQGQPGGGEGGDQKGDGKGGKEDAKGDAKGDKGGEMPTKGGSCADGKYRDYESQDTSDAVSPSERRSLAAACAQAFKESNTRGIGSADWQRELEALTEEPKVPWQNMLQGYVTQGVIRTEGKDEYSYHAPHRFTSIDGFDLVRPVMCSFEPKIAVVLDESGSMGGGEGSRRARAHTELKAILQHVQAKCKVVTFDSVAYDSGFVDNIETVKFKGGGGTDVRIPLKHLDEEENPDERVDIAIVCTDCETPWPDKEVGYDCIVLDCRDGGKCEGVPEWCQYVCMDD